MISYPQLNNKGRLGNQLFQIASTIGIAKSLGQEVCFPDWEYQHCFKNKLPKAEITPELALVEQKCDYHPFDKNIIDNDKDLVLEGYFQSEKYFLDAEEDVRKYFEFSDEILKRIEEKYSKILREYDTTIHVRRGDYVNLQDVYWNLSHLYYFKATELLLVKKAVIFSDDIKKIIIK